MHRLVATAVAVLGLLGPSAGTVRAEVTAEQVRTAIDRGIACLFAQQCHDGSWPERNAYWRDKIGYPGGVSALCTLALLNAGGSTSPIPPCSATRRKTPPASGST